MGPFAALLLAALVAGCGGGGGGANAGPAPAPGGDGGGSSIPGGGGSTLTLAADAPGITEPAAAGTRELTFVLTLGSAPATAIAVDYATLLTGTATSGVDFVAAAGTIDFAAGQTVATVSVTVNGDATPEVDETVLVQFSSTSLAGSVTGTGTILKNDTVGTTVALTAGGTDTTAGLGLTANDDTITGTIDQNTPVAGSLQASDIFDGGDGTDTLTLTPVVTAALILDDSLFTGVTGMERIVINTTTTGPQTIITGTQFNKAFGAAGINLDTTSSTGAMTITTNSFSGATTLAATSTTGSQSITTGTGVTTVTSTATTGSRIINSAAAVVATVTLTSGDALGGNTITTGTGNDTITILPSGTVASTVGNTITGGPGADTVTLANDASNDTIVIADGDSGITVATADSITNFTSADDRLKTGLAGSAANYAEAGAPVADFAAALAAANMALDGSVRYSFQFVGAGPTLMGYLFKDTDGDGTADQVVVLVGVDNIGFQFQDIIL